MTQGTAFLPFGVETKCVGEGFSSIGLLRAGNLLFGRIGGEINAAIFGIGIVDGGPCGHAGLRLH
jgi:hypothetical protein